MTGYHPFLSRLKHERPVALAARLLQARGAGTGRALDELTVGRMSRDRLMSELLDWCDSTGLNRGQGDFGFIMWAHGISAGLRDRYDREGVA